MNLPIVYLIKHLFYKMSESSKTFLRPKGDVVTLGLIIWLITNGYCLLINKQTHKNVLLSLKLAEFWLKPDLEITFWSVPKNNIQVWYLALILILVPE